MYKISSTMELLWCQLGSPINGGIQCLHSDWKYLITWLVFHLNLPFAVWQIFFLISLHIVMLCKYNRHGWLFCISLTDVHSQCSQQWLWRQQITTNIENCDFIVIFFYFTNNLPWFSWWRGTVVERRSLAGELSLSCARPAADGWPLMWLSHPL